MISACDTSGKQGMSARQILAYIRDKKLSDKVVAEWKTIFAPKKL